MNKVQYSPRHLKLASVRAVSGIGGTIQYSRHSSTEELLSNLTTLVAVIGDEDQTINGSHKEAEAVAIALIHLKEHELAFNILKAVVVNTPPEEVLFVRRRRDTYVSENFSPVLGKLGYTGVFQFAKLALSYKEKDLAIALFLQIAERIPLECPPLNLISTRSASIDKLVELGVKTLCRGRPIEEVALEAERRTV